ncbi:MAG: hypothetical protein LUG60_06055 [Erysipelotrichaceae bacterium]|nr:hypothetical protein [Erysipelotrichaceae bacterium]
MRFIIPKNFKMGKYLFNKYRTTDLIILIVGCLIGMVIAVSMVMITLNTSIIIFSIIGIIIGFTIAGACIILIANTPYYFNYLEFILTVIDFYTRDRTFIWYGIDYNYEEDDKIGKE